jgi:hypothetical protein
LVIYLPYLPFYLVIAARKLFKIFPTTGVFPEPTFSIKTRHMLSKKTKGLFVEVNGFSYQVAAVTGLNPPFTVDALYEFPRHEPGKLRDFLEESIGSGRSRFLNAHCGIVPESRFFRLHSIESMTKAKDPDYFANLLEQQFRLNAKSSLLSAVNAQSGAAFSPDKSLASQKELILCGADKREFTAFQENLVECGIYPQSLQLSTLSSLAGMKHYLQVTNQEDPVLLIEMTQNAANLFILSKDKVDLCRPVNFGFNGVLPVIQQELGLKDEDSARNLFFSNTFDFRDVGPKLLKRVIKELNASTGFYEVQTGQTIPCMYMTSIPENLSWIPEVIASEMDINLLEIDWQDWASSVGVNFGDDCSAASFGSSKFALFSLFVNFDNL